MPRIETVLRVFIASPADVSEERRVAVEVIDQLNNTWSKHLGVRLEPVMWETHAFPGVGEDPQDVINRQINDDYDVFVGILWQRFGSPTSRSESGTQEEFERAYARFRADERSVKIMFYFKAQPISPIEMDIEQMQKLASFRSDLGERGALYWTFSDTNDFASMLSVHLSKQAQEFVASANRSGATDLLHSAGVVLSRQQVEEMHEEEDDDAGFLDYVQSGNVALTVMSGFLSNIAAEIGAFNTKIERRTIEMQLATATADPQPMWRVAKDAAGDMDALSSYISSSLPDFSIAVEDAFGSMSGASALFMDFAPENVDELHGMLEQLRLMAEAAQGSLASTRLFRERVATFPRMSSPLNKARRRLVEALDGLIAEISRSENLATSVGDEIETLLLPRESPLLDIHAGALPVDLQDGLKYPTSD